MWLNKIVSLSTPKRHNTKFNPYDGSGSLCLQRFGCSQFPELLVLHSYAQLVQECLCTFIDPEITLPLASNLNV